ncbi:hypothetical protein [Flavobacterium sp. NKUCC04_CG]|uniref:hypothetical protein n=1 Tax=Flavobacterium sp. NKUCC04_CG TaxID=2842121 RepID=UPI001C5AEE33|nr:hypothetical protein [Flavobacterium sp. NKUCC04_CG]MBW3518585.1 hypothetical protein [Flavobacterium sp. NKUCC04_CG]
MTTITTALYSFSNGAFIMIGVFAVVCIAIVAAIFLLMGSDKGKKTNDEKSKEA